MITEVIVGTVPSALLPNQAEDLKQKFHLRTLLLSLF